MKQVIIYQRASIQRIIYREGKPKGLGLGVGVGLRDA